jgi:hypothetical protein
VTVYIQRLYHIGRVVELDQLERGLVMYEITCNKQSRYGGRLGVGFVFISPRDRERDYRDVDGSRLQRYASFSTAIGGKKFDREQQLDGFDRAVDRYRATLRSK